MLDQKVEQNVKWLKYSISFLSHESNNWVITETPSFILFFYFPLLCSQLIAFANPTRYRRFNKSSSGVPATALREKTRALVAQAQGSSFEPVVLKGQLLLQRPASAPSHSAAGHNKPMKRFGDFLSTLRNHAQVSSVKLIFIF